VFLNVQEEGTYSNNCFKGFIGKVLCGLSSILHSILINSTEQSPSGAAKNCSASQDIPPIAWNPEVHYQDLKRK
jgi:hypothetical protein